jgi:hypothetical protein
VQAIRPSNAAELAITNLGVNRQLPFGQCSLNDRKRLVGLLSGVCIQLVVFVVPESMEPAGPRPPEEFLIHLSEDELAEHKGRIWPNGDPDGLTVLGFPGENVQERPKTSPCVRRCFRNGLASDGPVQGMSADRRVELGHVDFDEKPCVSSMLCTRVDAFGLLTRHESALAGERDSVEETKRRLVRILASPVRQGDLGADAWAMPRG